MEKESVAGGAAPRTPKTRFTPAPWFVSVTVADENVVNVVSDDPEVFDDDHVVALCIGQGKRPAHNTILISTAPELYDALSYLIAYTEDLLREPHVQAKSKWAADERLPLLQAHATLAKARGEL